MTIRIRGAREHNLRAVDLDLPHDAFVVFCGRSGSGKSSLAMDTLHAEGRRRYLDALAFGRRWAQGPLPRPAVDVIEGLVPTVAVAQVPPPPARSASLASASGLSDVLRVLWGRQGTLHDPETGAALEITPHDSIVAALAALPEGSRLHVEAPVRVRADAAGVLDEIVRAGFSRVRLEGEVRGVEQLRPSDVGGTLRVVVDRIAVRAGREERLHDAVRMASRVGDGVVVAVTDAGETTWRQRAVTEAGEVLPALSPRLLQAPGPHACRTCGGRGSVGEDECADCGGSGLGPVGRAVRFAGHTLPEIASWTVSSLGEAATRWPRTAVSGPVLDELLRRVQALERLDLGGLPLDRDATSLSTGEWQRVRLATHLGADLSGVLVIVDEPEAGLDVPRVADVVQALRALKELGNGLIVVSHHPEVLAAADHVVEFGPGPGPAGGRVLYEGAPDGLHAADTPTGAALRGEIGVERLHVGGLDEIVAGGLTLRRGALNVLTGPSGSGKSRSLAALEGAIASGDARGVDGLERIIGSEGGAARGGRRSMPATYVGLWDVMRDLLAATQEARVRGLSARAFSLNVPGGRCEACEGLGTRRLSLDVVADVEIVCEVCEGRRFSGDVLAVTWKGLDAAALLDLVASEARRLLSGHPKLDEPLRALCDVGLGHVPLGQPVDTLSGGEQRRLRLARELVRAVRRGAEDTLLLLDDPTAGLHPADVPTLVTLLDGFVARGATVVVTSHDPALIDVADRQLRMADGGVAQVSDGRR